jgi:uncharacterized protein involved in response to NO
MHDEQSRAAILFAYPFRIFFLSALALAVLIIPAWLSMLWQSTAWPLALSPLAWHQHEMAVGFLNAAIAGFLLTAVCHWTNTRPLRGTGLLALWLLWLAGRLGLALGESFPGLAAALDLAFLPCVMAVVGYRVWQARQYRQLVLLLVLAMLWGVDLLFHVTGDLSWSHALVVLAAVLILVVGGRITPAFTRNWLHRHQGAGEAVMSFRGLDAASIVSALCLVMGEITGVQGMPLAVVAFVAALLALLRLSFWAGWRVRNEPLLWVLHMGMLWVVAGFALRGFNALGLVSDSVWLHALGPGAMGTMIVAVITRVSLGHTGRALLLPEGVLSCYLLVIAAGLLRLFTGLGLLGWHLGLWSSALCWTLAFLRLLYFYWPILSRPRIDGRAG